MLFPGWLRAGSFWAAGLRERGLTVASGFRPVSGPPPLGTGRPLCAPDIPGGAAA